MLFAGGRAENKLEFEKQKLTTAVPFVLFAQLFLWALLAAGTTDAPPRALSVPADIPASCPSARASASSETESEAGDIMDQQFEEMSHKLDSTSGPTGFLRMVSRNNLFNR